MTTVGREISGIVWMLCLLVVIVFVMTVRGPIRDAAWERDCEALRAGKSISGHWNTIEPCRDVLDAAH